MDNEKIKKINLGKDFNPAPAGRYKTDGKFSGERFREDFLIPCLKKYKKVIINLNGLDGIGPSFWDEAFAGLIIKENYSIEELNQKLEFECSDDIYLISHIQNIMLDIQNKTISSK